MSLKHMILQRGITGFSDRGQHGTMPKFSLAEFKRIVFAAARPLKYGVSDIVESGVTPNFHSALLTTPETAVSVIGHSTYPVFAVSEPLQTYLCELSFADCEALSREIEAMFPSITFATADELNCKPTESNLVNLDKSELEQLTYWKPQTIGEVVFNWWD